MEAFDNAKKWLLGVAVKKVAIKAGVMAVTWIGSGFAATALTNAGVQYDPIKLQASISGGILAGFKAFEDWVNLKYGLNI